jgi:hypothetical protein
LEFYNANAKKREPAVYSIVAVGLALSFKINECSVATDEANIQSSCLLSTEYIILRDVKIMIPLDARVFFCFHGVSIRLS